MAHGVDVAAPDPVSVRLMGKMADGERLRVVDDVDVVARVQPLGVANADVTIRGDLLLSESPLLTL